MSMAEVFGIFGLFGIVCAFHVSVVGFALTAVAVSGVLALLHVLTSNAFGGWALGAAFVSMQVGYFVGLILSGLVAHWRGVTPSYTHPKYTRPMVNDLNVHHE